MSEAVGPDPTRQETLERMLYREFLTQKDLYREVGLERLPEKLAALTGLPKGEVLSHIMGSPELTMLGMDDLRRLVRVHDMTFLSRTAAVVAGELKRPEVEYISCIREALSFAISDCRVQAFAALRAAANHSPESAYHHFIYGLLQALGANNMQAQKELSLALEREPYEDGRRRIRTAISLVEGR
ncbi:MAG: hypothetical protein JRH20_07670 [Deltaproteobacteria bacterium]|nr:hypothetical protein [Deltaproteobacteria bacterium]